jgi:hypothetical protein
MIFKTALFQSPMYKFKASNHSYIKKHMMDTIYPSFLSDGFNSQDRKLYSSYFPNAVPIDQDFFIESYKSDILKFINKAGFSSNHTWEHRARFWYNIGVDGTYQEVHDHVGGPFPINYAGVHFVNFDKTEHQGTAFYHPMESMIRSLQPTSNENFRPDDFNNLIKFAEVEEGDIIIFPGYVPHSVMTQHSDIPRVTVSFNLSIYDNG